MRLGAYVRTVRVTVPSRAPWTTPADRGLTAALSIRAELATSPIRCKPTVPTLPTAISRRRTRRRGRATLPAPRRSPASTPVILAVSIPQIAALQAPPPTLMGYRPGAPHRASTPPRTRPSSTPATDRLHERLRHPLPSPSPFWLYQWHDATRPPDAVARRQSPGPYFLSGWSTPGWRRRKETGVLYPHGCASLFFSIPQALTWRTGDVLTGRIMESTTL